MIANECDNSEYFQEDHYGEFNDLHLTDDVTFESLTTHQQVHVEEVQAKRASWERQKESDDEEEYYERIHDQPSHSDQMFDYYDAMGVDYDDNPHSPDNLWQTS